MQEFETYSYENLQEYGERSFTMPFGMLIVLNIKPLTIFCLELSNFRNRRLTSKLHTNEPEIVQQTRGRGK